MAGSPASHATLHICSPHPSKLYFPPFRSLVLVLFPDPKNDVIRKVQLIHQPVGSPLLLFFSFLFFGKGSWEKDCQHLGYATKDLVQKAGIRTLQKSKKSGEGATEPPRQQWAGTADHEDLPGFRGGSEFLPGVYPHQSHHALPWQASINSSFSNHNHSLNVGLCSHWVFNSMLKKKKIPTEGLKPTHSV